MKRKISISLLALLLLAGGGYFSFQAIKIEVKASKNKKCDRCWHYVPSVGMNSEHPSICQRCISNLFEEGEERNHA